MRSNPSNSGQHQPSQQQQQQPQIPIQSYQEQRPGYYDQRMFVI
jgi:hypothetical protein